MSQPAWGAKGVRCLAIVANALCAGGLYSFPLFSPALVEHHHFTQPQLTTIALAGMVGQYPFAALVGKVLDTRGARTCSFIAGLCFSLGFGLFAYEIVDVPPKEVDTTAVFRRMVVYFAMVGLGTVFSYFSIVFSATQTFPHYIGVASGTSMGLFGCSPLLLSVIADHFFTTDDTLNVARFLTFLSITTGVVHLFGALALPGRLSTTSPAPQEQESENVVSQRRASNEAATPPEAESSSAETSPLLSRRHSSLSPPGSDSPKQGPSIQVGVASVECLEVSPPQHGSTADLVHDPCFWALGLTVAIVLGCSEMVITNFSSIFLSLGTSTMPSITPLIQRAAGTSITTQVQLLSLTNTLSRLVIGPLADFIAPVPVSFLRPTTDAAADDEETSPSDGSRYELEGVDNSEVAPLTSDDHKKERVYYAFPRKHYVSRIAFLLGACTLLLFAFVSFLTSNSHGARAAGESMSLLSVGVGICYGMTFTVLPGILSAIYGPANLGRNFGVLSYAPFVGTSVFSYLYAFLADRQASSSTEPSLMDVVPEEGQTCRGPQCWQITFSVSIAALAFASGTSTVLWRKWRGRV